MRIGIKVPNTGGLPARRPIGDLGRLLEDAGADSVWVSDHIAMPRVVESEYPFAADRRVSWSTDVDWYDAVIAMAQLVAATRRVRVGAAVLVLPLRNPVEFAKQIASIAAQSGGGRLVLGVGAGWMREEFEALGVPFAGRGARLEEWIEIARRCWTGTPEAFDGVHHRLPAGFITRPALPHPPPFLIGGAGPAGIRRSATMADGLLGHTDLADVDPEGLGELVAAVRAARTGSDRRGHRLEFPLRIVQTEGRDAIERLACWFPELRAAGITEVIVDLDWSGDAEAEAAWVVRRLRDAAGRSVI